MFFSYFFDYRAQLRPDPEVFPVPGQHLEELRRGQALSDQPEEMLIRTCTGEVNMDRSRIAG